jgi:hypothetical protein
VGASAVALSRRTLVRPYTFKLVTSLFTRAEASFYLALRKATADRYAVFAKVRIADLCAGLDKTLDPDAFNRVRAMHGDFLICDPETFRPLLVIELQSTSHLRARSRYNDELKERVLRTLGLRLLPEWGRSSYSPELIRRNIEGALRAK